MQRALLNGPRGIQIDDVVKESDKKMMGLRALAKAWKSGSRAQSSQIDYLSKRYNKKMIGLRAQAKSWKSSSKARGLPS